MGLVTLRNLNGNGPASVEYSIALSSASRTATGAAILSFLAAANRPFDVVVLPLDPSVDYGQMLTNEDRSGAEVIKARDAYAKAFGHTEAQAATVRIPRPTVFWNPAYTFEYYADVRGCMVNARGDIVAKTMLQLQRGDFYYQYGLRPGQKTQVPVVRYTKASMASWIVLLHELGHVKQFYEAGGDQGWNTRLQQVDAIEADNLRDHENPICRESQPALPIREHYKHMPKGMEDVINGYNASMQKKNALRISTDALGRINDDRALELEARGNADREERNEPRGLSIPIPSSAAPRASVSVAAPPPLLSRVPTPPLSPRGSMSIPMAPPFSKVPTPPALGRVPSFGAAPPPPPPLSPKAIPLMQQAEAVVGFFEKR